MIKEKVISDFKVVEVEKISSMCSLLTLKSENDYLPEIEPGQFVNIYVPEAHNAFLRRPISVCDYNEDGSYKILVKRAGEATGILCDAKEGDIFNILVPLGRSFNIPENRNSRILLIGGGVGVAPIYFLGKKLKNLGFTPEFLLGASSVSEIYMLDKFNKTGVTFISTIDGSLGEKGLVTDNSVLDRDYDFIYTCGPLPMMKAVAKIVKTRDVECEVSLENKMACGLGACLCCVEDTKEGHLCVCKDGPVFNIKELKW